MAKKDSIFNYAGSFDTSPYIDGCKATWAANKSKSERTNDPYHRFFNGDPANVTDAAPSGWDEGNWSFLDFYDITWESGRDDEFQSTPHKLIYDIKRAFNLPNQETLSSWKDEYTRASGEVHHYRCVKAGTQNTPYILPTTDDQHKCSLLIGIEGFSVYGGTDQEDSIDVRPNMKTRSVFNDHYATQHAASTAAADYTSPTLVGSEFTQRSSCMLINLESGWRGTPVMPKPNDLITINIIYSSHTYAQIKTLIDTAIA